MFINQDAINNFSFELFNKKYPFPWNDFSNFLTDSGFRELHNNFPSIELFEYHQHIYRGEQRPHDRYYLAYEKSIYKSEATEKGIAQAEDLPECWRLFIHELEGEIYQKFIKQALGVENFYLRYAWHMGRASNEVSPHLDEKHKAGTHIFYFNTSEDWNKEWGGQLIVLGGLNKKISNPEFHDFTLIQPISNMNNHSFLFKNSPKAWHGVRPLKCPENNLRKLFNVIVQQL